MQHALEDALLTGFMQDGYKSDYNDCNYHGSGAAYLCCYLQQVQIEPRFFWRSVGLLDTLFCFVGVITTNSMHCTNSFLACPFDLKVMCPPGACLPKMVYFPQGGFVFLEY